jgi:hypothetical protein
MPAHLISKELDNLLFLDVINDFREHSKLISILISSITQQSPLISIYKAKKKLLLDNLNFQRINAEKNHFREKLVSVLNFGKFKTLKIGLVIFYLKKKLNEGKNGMNFSSNIDYIEKLSSLLDSNKTQSNRENISGIPIERKNAKNETNVNSCSSTIKIEPLLMPKSKIFKVDSSIKKTQM